MMVVLMLLFSLLLLLLETHSIWPPSYKINLSHEETFVISEVLDSDVLGEDDEMIKSIDLKSFHIESDEGKYDRLHKLANRRNTAHSKTGHRFYNNKRLKKRAEYNWEKEEPIPWESGFLDKTGKIKSDTKTIFALDKNILTVNETWKNASKRDIKDTEEGVNYDYESLRSEYNKNMKKLQIDKDTLNYTESKDEESFKDAISAIVGNNQTRNCTIEEQKGIGIAAAKCMWSDLTKPNLNEKERSTIFHRIWTIIMIWIAVYFLVAIPCWCQRGWCCCCFQCKFCKPLERIDVAKKYLMDNPLGVYHTPDDRVITYEPTNYEKYAQNNLEKALSKL